MYLTTKRNLQTVALNQSAKPVRLPKIRNLFLSLQKHLTEVKFLSLQKLNLGDTVSRDRDSSKKEQDIARGLSFLQEKKSKLQQADNGTKLINLGHSKWEKIAPQISTDLEGINAIPL